MVVVDGEEVRCVRVMWPFSLWIIAVAYSRRPQTWGSDQYDVVQFLITRPGWWGRGVLMRMSHLDCLTTGKLFVQHVVAFCLFPPSLPDILPADLAPPGCANDVCQGI